MQSPASTNPIPDPQNVENKYPECLVLEIEGVPISNNDPVLWDKLISLLSNKKPSQTQEDFLELHLSLQFNEHENFAIPGGTISFGIRKGELRIKLVNGKIPLKFRELGNLFESSIPKKVEEKRSREKQDAVKGSLTEKGAGLEATHGNKKTEEITNKVEYISSQINPKGSEVEPAWVFETKTGEPVLKGLLRKTKLATVVLEGRPCTITATFKITPKRDIQITDASGIWLKDIKFRQLSHEKQRSLDLWLIKKLFLKSTFEPYLSKIELHYDN